MTELITEYLQWLTDRGCTDATLRARRDILTRAEAELPYGLGQALESELRDWIFQDRYSAWTRCTYYGAIAAFYAWACNPYRPRLDSNPAAMLPRPATPRSLPRPVSDEQLRLILSESEEPIRTWALLAAYQGLRCIEIARLYREHVTPDTLAVVRGKGGKPAILPTYPAVWAALERLPPGPVALTQRGDQASATYVSLRAATHFRRRLGLAVGLHRLRHWYGSMLYQQTRDLRNTQELLRHASPMTTAGYTHIPDEERRAAIHSLPSM